MWKFHFSWDEMFLSRGSFNGMTLRNISSPTIWKHRTLRGEKNHIGNVIVCAAWVETQFLLFPYYANFKTSWIFWAIFAKLMPKWIYFNLINNSYNNLLTNLRKGYQFIYKQSDWHSYIHLAAGKLIEKLLFLPKKIVIFKTKEDSF